MRATDPPGVVLARNDGLIVVLDAVPITRGLVETVERICEALGIPARDERRDDGTEDT